MMNEEFKLTRRRLMTIYRNMIKRCYDKNSKDYKYYGAKGIKVCYSWKTSFASFCIWALMNGYRNDLTIDRINSSDNYCPENCRWVDMRDQSKNKSQTRKITIQGKTMCLKDWCRELGINYYTVCMRIHRGMDEKEAIGIHE